MSISHLGTRFNDLDMLILLFLDSQKKKMNNDQRKAGLLSSTQHSPQRRAGKNSSSSLKVGDTTIESLDFPSIGPLCNLYSRIMEMGD